MKIHLSSSQRFNGETAGCATDPVTGQVTGQVEAQAQAQANELLAA